MSEVVILTDRYLDTLLKISCTVALGVGEGSTFFSPINKKMINKILDNLVFEFKQGKLAACIKCLESNNLSPLSDEEKEEIM